MALVDSLLFQYIFYHHTSLLVTNNVDMTYHSGSVLCNLKHHLLAHTVSHSLVTCTKDVLDTDRPH
jgi:hypothetical protein